jgi:hypothetical protein
MVWRGNVKGKKGKVNKKKRKEPTLKQKRAVRLILENAGSIGEAMRKAGYKPGTVKNPKELTESDGFIQLLEKTGVTDERLSKKADQLLDAKKVVGYLNSNVKGAEKVSDEFVEVPDNPIQHRTLETMLKVKGHMREKVETGKR